MSSNGWEDSVDEREEGHETNGEGGDPADISGIQSALLRNPVRRGIVEQLGRTPGLNKNQLCDELDILPNLLDFHLERLEDNGIVVTRPSAQGREILCFLRTDKELWEDDELRIMFGRRSTREIGLYVAENPGAETTDIAEAIDLSEVTVRHHLRTLREHEMVQRIRLGRRFEYHPSDLLEEWTDLVGDAFGKPWEPDVETRA